MQKLNLRRNVKILTMYKISQLVSRSIYSEVLTATVKHVKIIPSLFVTRINFLNEM